jgi:hypothetical protein
VFTGSLPSNGSICHNTSPRSPPRMPRNVPEGRMFFVFLTKWAFLLKLSVCSHRLTNGAMAGIFLLLDRPIHKIRKLYLQTATALSRCHSLFKYLSMNSYCMLQCYLKQNALTDSRTTLMRSARFSTRNDSDRNQEATYCAQSEQYSKHYIHNTNNTAEEYSEETEGPSAYAINQPRHDYFLK